MGPRADALLVDHPGLPVPQLDGGRVRARPVRGRVIGAAGRTVRERAALQLVAMTSVLADLDLWPGAGMLRRARLVDGPDGPVARVPRFPSSLSRTLERLGGGEGAVETLRDACLAAVADATGVHLDAGTAPGGGESFFVEREVLGVRRLVGARLDDASARSLWALQWSSPPLPDPDDVAYWEVRDPTTWLRLAAAALVVCRRTGGSAWVWDVGQEGETAPLPVVDARGLLVTCGALGDPELAAVDRWARRPGCSALVIGRFPAGWAPPPPPVFDPDRPAHHLVVAGISSEQSRFEVESRRRRFDPFAEADRQALTAAVGGRVGEREHRDGWGGPLLDWLGLAPDGLPAGVLAVHARARPQDLDMLRRAGVVVEQAGMWRLSISRRLEPDPRHRLVADVYPADDPRRLRHLALAGDDRGRLGSWIRDRLDDLDPTAVRRLLHPVRRDALEVPVQVAWIEACLADLDLTVARDVLDAVPITERPPWQAWMEVLDRPSGPIDLGDLEAWLESAPRAAAAVGLRALRRAVRQGDEADAESCVHLLAQASARLAPALAKELEIERLVIVNPDAFGDRHLRRRLAGHRPELWFRMLHHHANRLADLHRTRPARRLLERLQRTVPAEAAGWRGMLELDLGSVALEEGDSRLASHHHLRASRLLEAAGFRRRLQTVRFNLAVSDLDLMRLESAAARLADCGPPASDPHVAGELVRLALARGDLDEVERAVVRYRELASSDDPRLADGLRWVEGIRSLLAGRTRYARTCFSEAGDHAMTWWRLCDALVRRTAPAGDPPAFDDWGLEIAARVIAAGSVESVVDPRSPMDGSTALALALVDRLAGDLDLGDALRRRAAGTLQRLGADGWAAELRRSGTDDLVVLAPLVRMAESGTVADPRSDEVTALLAAVDLTGLEVWDGGGQRRLWTWGSGDPGDVVTGGRLRFVPLGGSARDGPVWRLLVAVVELLHRDVVPAAVDGDAADRLLLGDSAAMARLRDELRQYASTAVTVLLRGETGVGKEVAARALHELSGRSGRFIPVNVAAVPESLLEAELFGTTRGAFTGADRARSGLAVAADGGTLFLDEIGDLGLGLQVKLLRFLESREVRAVGSSSVREVDVRIVAATHRDLKGRRESGSFRSDLYFRIAQAPVDVPPLRDRSGDLPVLVDRFMEEARVRHGLEPCRLSQATWDALRAHPWPGNVRELRHVIEVVMARCGGGIASTDLLPFETSAAAAPPTSWRDAHHAFRVRLIRETLERHDGNRTAAARALGISRQALLYHMRNLGMRAGAPDRERDEKGAGPEARRRKEEV